MTRRLVGWRVRYEYRVGREWRADWTMLAALPAARATAAELRIDDRCRAVRVMRVYWRSGR